MFESRVALIAALAAGVAMIAACTTPAPPPSATQSPEPVRIMEEAESVAVVESVNQRTREVVLRGQDGDRVSMTAGPEVRNLAQLRRGDRVVVTYGEALAVEMASGPDADAA
jgi:uncharacterized lipoprotein YajG